MNEVSHGELKRGETPELRRLIVKYSHQYGIPESLMHRMIKRESGYNPKARNGPYLGLLQIHPNTARTMGFTGKPSDLLDAETNLKYAGKYLRGAWLVSDGSQDKAERWYANGYYYEAKRRGMLRQTGLK
jgi:soluble lytic murein transglycosylase-like protein